MSSKTAIHSHNYTVSAAAKDHLIELFAAAAQSGIQTARKRATRQRPTIMISADGRVVPMDAPSHSTRRAVGITHALRQLQRTYDLTDYIPKPSIPYYLTTPGTTSLFYNPPDLEYLELAEQDSTSWNDLPNWEREDRLKELNRKRGWHPDRPGFHSGNLSLSLPNDTRRYYHSLRVFHNIPLLPGCRRPESLTMSVSTVLEAIGTGHLELPADYIYAISTPNKRLASALRIRLNNNYGVGHGRKYGNHTGEAYMQREWRSLPLLENFTQDDVDYCLRPDNRSSLADVAVEACALNPSLVLPSNIAPVIGDPTTTTTAASRAKPHIDLVPASPSREYLYKGRDVTQVVNLAIEAHYLNPEPVSFPKLAPLAAEHGLPLYMLQRLATREWVRRTLAEESTSD